jgi:hypothetical protein
LEDVARVIAEFAAADKAASGRFQWALEPHTDTAKTNLLVVVPSRPIFAAKLYLTAHVHREPFKYGCCLSLATSYRVLGLDVNPGSSHANFTDLRKVSVRCTHWQMTES